MSVVVVVVMAAWCMSLSLLMVFFKRPAWFSDRSFGFVRSASASWLCLCALASAVLGTALVGEFRSKKIIVHGVCRINWCVHFVSLAVGCRTQRQFQVLVLTLQLRRDIFSLVQFNFECFDALWKIDCFSYQVLFFVSKLVNLHQKFSLLLSGLVWCLMVHFQVLDLLL